MDIHVVDSDEFSAEDVVKAHMEDLAIQDQFGVQQLKYWVNEDAKTIFCLMKGPDKESCHQVHLKSHGNTACNIIEVSDNEYNLFMGQGTDVHDLAKTDSGQLDTGYRTILLTNFVNFSKSTNSRLDKILELISKHGGSPVREPNHQVMASFVYAQDAISCAHAIKHFLDDPSKDMAFNIAVVSGKPVDEDGQSFFQETKARVNELCSLGFNSNIYLDKETISLAEKEGVIKKAPSFRPIVLNTEDLSFLRHLSRVVHRQFSRPDFSREELFIILGLSKSQAGRKIKALTGLAPNQLIQEVRLQEAIGKMEGGKSTMSEIAYGSGFNSPAYFTRTFKKRFGITPSSFSKEHV